VVLDNTSHLHAQEHEAMHVIDFGSEEGQEDDAVQERQPQLKRSRRGTRADF
jgi:hypothetical protein